MNRGRIENLKYSWIASGVYVQYGNTCGRGGGDGMFMPESVVKISDVTDGMSNTFLIGEMSRFPNEQGSIPWMWANLASVWGDETWWPNGKRVTGGASSSPRRTRRPTQRANIFNACFQNCVLPPDWLNNAAIPGGPCNSLGQWAFRSFHPGGVNFAMADGSVRFIKDSINLPTYRVVGTRALGEVITRRPPILIHSGLLIEIKAMHDFKMADRH